MKVLVTAAVLLIMLARVNSVPLESVRLLAFVSMFHQVVMTKFLDLKFNFDL